MKHIEKKRPVKYPTVEFWQREECEDQWFLSDVEWYSRRFGPMVLSRDGLPFDAVLEVQDKDGENSVLHLYSMSACRISKGSYRTSAVHQAVRMIPKFGPTQSGTTPVDFVFVRCI